MRLENVIEKDKCTGCMACRSICPVNAIKIKRDCNGFQYPKIDKEICIDCKLCEKICPVKNKVEQNEDNVIAYYCKNKDEGIRMESSSGGIFSLIAEWILNEKGVVFGAKFNRKFEVVHDYILRVDELGIFRGSKYLQSKIGNTYKRVKQFLEEDRKVLFTGTPCQIEGLMSYLKKDYKNLYTQDFICHGVPSLKVWKKYLEYKRKNTQEILKNVNFRRKDLLGWSNFQMNYKYLNSEENIHHDEDPYMNLFLRNFDLRESCYNCAFKQIKRKADVTLADCWGINEINPEFNDEKGISVIIIHSKKGQEILEKIKQNIEFSRINIQDIITHNSPICKSVCYNNKREEFFKTLNKEEFETIIRKFL